MSRLWLYRTQANDDDGDPFDHGVIRAKDKTAAEKQVRKQLHILGWEGAPTKIYPLKDRLTTGLLKGWDDEDPFTINGN